MWELDCEENWVPKNWCFWTVVLEKTLEIHLDCKENHPVHPKGDQSWVFIGRTDAELKLQYFGHLLRTADSLEKTVMLGGIGGRRRREGQRMTWLDDITDLMHMSLCTLRELLMDREAWGAAIHRVAKSRTWLSDWTELNWSYLRRDELSSKFHEETFWNCFQKVSAVTVYLIWKRERFPWPQATNHNSTQNQSIKRILPDLITQRWSLCLESRDYLCAALPQPPQLQRSSHTVTKASSRLGFWLSHLSSQMEWEMITHSSILAWRILWTEEPGGLQSMGLQESWTWWSEERRFLKVSQVKPRISECGLWGFWPEGPLSPDL